MQWVIYHSGFGYSCRLRKSRSSITKESSRSKFIFSNAKISFTRKVLFVSFDLYTITSCSPHYLITMYLHIIMISQSSCRYWERNMRFHRYFLSPNGRALHLPSNNPLCMMTSSVSLSENVQFHRWPSNWCWHSVKAAAWLGDIKLQIEKMKMLQ